MLDKRMGFNERVCPCTQTEEYYVCTDGQMVYLRDQMAQKPSIANPLVPTMPPRDLLLVPCYNKDEQNKTTQVMRYI